MVWDPYWPFYGFTKELDKNLEVYAFITYTHMYMYKYLYARMYVYIDFNSTSYANY